MTHGERDGELRKTLWLNFMDESIAEFVNMAHFLMEISVLMEFGKDDSKWSIMTEFAEYRL